MNVLRLSGNVARSDHHGKSEHKTALVLPHHFLVLDVYGNGVVGSNVGDGCGKDIRAFLFQKTDALAFSFCLSIGLFGFCTLLNLAFDDSFADSHAQVIDSSLVR